MARSQYSTATINGVNPYINTTTVSSEQGLIQNLVDEMISIYGQALIYIPRNINNFDQMYFTDDQSSYSTFFTLEMLIENITGFSPQPNDNIFSKFGLEIRSQIVFSVSVDRFATVIGSIANISRPREGDLIYLPIHKKVFQIKFTENKEIFYELGALYTFKMTTELFEYSNETFNTGIPEIDILQKRFDTNELNYGITDENGIELIDESGNPLLQEGFDISKIDPIADNNELKKEASGIIDFSISDPFGEISHVK
jgi:hypothetical protein